MNMVQIYETRVMAKTSAHSAHVIVVPARSYGLPVPATPSSPRTGEVMEQLGLQKIAEVSPHRLAQGLALLVSPSMPTDSLSGYLKSLCKKEDDPCSGELFAKTDMEFAEQLAFECPMPFESSPLSGEILVKLVTKATGAGIGAFAGFVAFGASPLLLITVPAGMVLCGAAKGVAEALEAGLRDRLTDFLKGQRKPGKEKG